MELTKIGPWAFVGGIVLAIITGFVAIPAILIFLFILGLIVGFLNITERESTSFLVALTALLVMGVAGLQLGGVTEVVTLILQSFIAFTSAAGLVVAVKQILAIAR